MTHALLVAAMVMIRTYNYMPVPADDLARARATVDRTFQDAGISLQWLDCAVDSLARRSAQREGGSIVDRPSSVVERRLAIGDRLQCAQPLREGSEFVLRLVPPPAADHSSSRIVAMGSSLINHDSRAGALATVDPELVLKIARGSGANFSTLLGRAIAHELGHLLLGHSQHSSAGLMRALWSQDEIRGLRSASWQFSEAEAAQMRQGLAARARSGN